MIYSTILNFFKKRSFVLTLRHLLMKSVNFLILKRKAKYCQWKIIETWRGDRSFRSFREAFGETLSLSSMLLLRRRDAWFSLPSCNLWNLSSISKSTQMKKIIEKAAWGCHVGSATRFWQRSRSISFISFKILNCTSLRFHILKFGIFGTIFMKNSCALFLDWKWIYRKLHGKQNLPRWNPSRQYLQVFNMFSSVSNYFLSTTVFLIHFVSSLFNSNWKMSDPNQTAPTGEPQQPSKKY